jgi:hypothetical protein
VAGKVTSHPEYDARVLDRYAESGKPDDLLRKYGMAAEQSVAAADRVLARK